MRRSWNRLRGFLNMSTGRTVRRGQPTRQRLSLESLEDRVVPTVVFNSALGGDTIFWVPGNSAGHPANQVQTSPITNNPSVLNNPTIYLDFWGNSWTESNAAPLASAANSIIQSKFFSQLSDYGFKGAISFGGYTIDNTETSDGNTGDPQNGKNLTTEIQNLLNGKLATDTKLPTSSWLRPPDKKPQDSPIYIVVYDNGSNAANSFANYTSSLVMNQVFIGDGGNSQDTFTDLLSHEVAERVSAGDGTGIEMNASNANTDGEYKDAQISDNEPDDGNYTYRINGPTGQLVQAYWSLTYNGFVVQDGNSQTVDLNPIWQTSPSLSFTGTYDLNITGGQLANPDDIMTLSETQFDGVSFTLNGQVFQFATGQINTIDIETSEASSTINVLATPAGTSTFIEDLGDDSVVVGNTKGNVDDGAGFLGDIHGLVAVAATGDIGEPGSTYLYLDDSGDTFGQTVTMNNGVIDYGFSAPIYYNPSANSTGDVTYLAVYGGSGGNTFNVDNTSKLYYKTFLSTGAGNDTVNIFATTGGLYDWNPGGSDTTNVGLGNTSNLNGFVDLDGSGSISLIVDDVKDATARTVTMYDGSLYGLGAGGIFWVPSSISTDGVTYLEVDGGTADNTFNVENTSDLYDDTRLTTGGGVGDGIDTVNVYATSGGLYDYNGSFFSSVNLGLGNMGSINGFVDVEGPSGTQLDLNDSADATARTVVMNDGSITGLGGGTGAISWTPTSIWTGGVTYVEVDGGSANNTFNVKNTSNLYAYTYLVTGAGKDTVNVSATKGAAATGGLEIFSQGTLSVDVGLGSVANINGVVSVDGLNAASMLVDDHLDSTSRTVTLNNGALTGLGNAGAVEYTSHVTSLSIDGPTKASTYNIQSNAAPTLVTVNAGAGNDVFNLGSGNSLDGILGPVTVNGGGGTNTLNANDSSSASGQTYTLSSSHLTRSGVASIAYASLSAINATGSGNDTLTLLNPVPIVTTHFNGGSGVNTLHGASTTNSWTISGANSGKLDSVSFSNIEKLAGGSGVDVFSFSGTSAKVLSISGDGAPAHQGDWLNYSAFPSSSTVTVNLGTGSAANVDGGAVGAVSNIQNVIGSASGANQLTGNSQGNILIGGSGINTLTGGGGDSLLIGGSGSGAITGGPNTDILIAGTTTYNALTTAGEDSLMAILAELRSTDTFAQKVSDIVNGNASGGGSDLNGGNKLSWGGSSPTVEASSGAFTLSGDASAENTADWFFSSTSSTVKDFDDDGVKDEHNNNAIGVF